MTFFKAFDPYEKFANSHTWSEAKILVFASLLGVMTALLQSAGSLLPFVGLLISPFTTLPIIVSVLISVRYGFLTYLLGAVLLMILEPSELFIYPFTTGLLGLSLGFTLRLLTNRLLMTCINASLLCCGICFPLYGLGMPVLGPFLQTFHLKALLLIWLFSVLYSAVWIGIVPALLDKINTSLRKR